MSSTAASVLAMSERSWGLEGPCSGGGRTVVYANHRVYVVSYGDAAIGYGELEECSVAGFCARYAAHEGARPAIDWLESLARGTPPRPLAAWLDARDGEALAGAWNALAAEPLEVGWLGAHLTGHGPARLAADLLDWPLPRVAWLSLAREMDAGGAPAAIFRIARPTAFCFLENAIHVREPSNENWEVREQREGARGVQWVRVFWGVDDGSREGYGGGGTVVRVFDEEANVAVSVTLETRKAAVVAPPHRRDEITARVRGALDLYGAHRNFRLPAWTAYEQDALRGLVAALASRIDPAFAGCATWPAKKTREETLTPSPRPAVLVRDWRFAAPTAPSRAVLLREHFGQVGTQPGAWMTASLEGLAFGHAFELNAQVTAVGCSATLSFRAPEAEHQVVAAALAAWPGAIPS